MNKIALAYLAATAGLAATAAAEVIENDTTKIVFADASDGYAVTNVTHKRTGVSFLAPSRGSGDLWILEFSRPSPTGGVERTTIDNHSHAQSRSSEHRPDGSLCLTWRGVSLKDSPRSVDVFARVRFDDGDGLAHWSIEIDNRSKTWALHTTTYPCLRNVAKMCIADVLVPWENLGAMLLKKVWSCGGFAMSVWSHGVRPQVAAWHIDGTGFYVASHDPERRIKKMGFMPREQSVRFETPVEYAGIPGKAANGPKHEVVTGTYEGDWWEAARTYRKWALRQRWAQKGMMVSRSDFPRRMADSHLWHLMHSEGQNFEKTLKKARDTWPDVNLAVEVTNWNFLPFDVNYPEYFPARYHVPPAFRKAHSDWGIMVMPYMNARLWDMGLNSFALLGAAEACIDENGGYYIEKWNKKRNTFAIMCPYGRMWGDIIFSNTKRVVEEAHGTCIYLDQVTCARSQPCFSEGHGHVPGGGTSWTDGYRRTLEKTHRWLAARKVPLTSEGAGDTWLDCVDGYLLAVIPRPEAVPFYSAVYSGYAVYYGCRLTEEVSPEAFFAVQAKAVLDGIVPGWITNYILRDDRKRHAEALHRLGRFRQANAEFIAYGTLEDELRYANPPEATRLEWSDVRNHTDFRTDVPCIRGSIWKNPSGRCTGIALINVSQKETSAKVMLPPGDYEVTYRDGSGTFVQNGASADVTLGAEAAMFVRTPATLPPKDDFDLYLLIGQSNMAGRGDLTDKNRIPAMNIMKLDPAGEWVAANEPLHLDVPHSGAGLGMSFARAVADASPEKTVGLIPCADGGTALSMWMPGTYLYENAVRRTRAAMRNGRLRGILWHQGEADCGSEETASTYSERLAKMVARLRADLGVGSDIPFIAGELGEFCAALNYLPNWKKVNEELVSAKAQIPGFGVVSAKGLSCKPDGIHFDTPSLRELGRRYAEALKAMR